MVTATRVLLSVAFVALVFAVAGPLEDHHTGPGGDVAFAQGCHASYPDFCIPPPPPDIACGDAVIAGRRNFRAFPPDPHNLDADDDGIACESATPIAATPTPSPNAVAVATIDPTLGPITPGPAPPATPVGPVSCSPRPRVEVSTMARSPGRFRALIAATSNPTGAANTVRALTFGTIRNATIGIVGVGTVTSGQTVQFAGGAPAVGLEVSRSAPGQGVFVPLTVTDGCGPWQTFVGAGPNAL